MYTTFYKRSQGRYVNLTGVFQDLTIGRIREEGVFGVGNGIHWQPQIVQTRRCQHLHQHIRSRQAAPDPEAISGIVEKYKTSRVFLLPFANRILFVLTGFKSNFQRLHTSFTSFLAKPSSRVEENPLFYMATLDLAMIYQRSCHS